MHGLSTTRPTTLSSAGGWESTTETSGPSSTTARALETDHRWPGQIVLNALARAILARWIDDEVDPQILGTSNLSALRSQDLTHACSSCHTFLPRTGRHSRNMSTCR